MSKLTITQWDISDRPREKYLTGGFTYLSDAELLAILLRSGTSTSSAVELAKTILADLDFSLDKLADMTVAQLTKYKGVGKVKAITILAAFELGRRKSSETVKVESKINCPEQVRDYMQDKNASLLHEEFWAIYVNQGSKILGSQRIGKGGITATTVDIRLIIKGALELSATGIFVAHNHPSGQMRPSESDKMLTFQLQQAARLMNLQLLDHVIVHKDRFFSFYENNLL